MLGHPIALLYLPSWVSSGRPQGAAYARYGDRKGLVIMCGSLSLVWWSCLYFKIVQHAVCCYSYFTQAIQGAPLSGMHTSRDPSAVNADCKRDVWVHLCLACQACCALVIAIEILACACNTTALDSLHR